jgi:hypothetical protein
MAGTLNQFECPVCRKPLNEADRAWALAIINVAIAEGALVLIEPPRELSCGHKATVEAAQFQSGSGFWLVSR